MCRPPRWPSPAVVGRRRAAREVRLCSQNREQMQLPPLPRLLVLCRRGQPLARGAGFGRGRGGEGRRRRAAGAGARRPPLLVSRSCLSPLPHTAPPLQVLSEFYKSVEKLGFTPGGEFKAAVEVNATVFLATLAPGLSRPSHRPPVPPHPFCFVKIGGAEGRGAYFAGRPRRRRDVAEAGTGRVPHPPGYVTLRYRVKRESTRVSALAGTTHFS